MGNAMMFIDLDNVYRGMLEHYGIEPTDKFIDGKDLLDVIIENEQQRDNTIQEIYAFADFKYIGNTRYKTSLDERSIQTIDVYSSNGNITRKNASDIQLSIEAVDCACNCDDISNYIIVSADSDMIPIMNYLKIRKRKRVTLYVLDVQASSNILSRVPNNGFFKIEDILNLSKPPLLETSSIDEYLPQMVKYIFDNEQYNKNKGNSRLYVTPGWYSWNVMRYHRINKQRLCSEHVDQTLKYASEKEIIFIEHNRDYGVDEIILNRNSEKVKEILGTLLSN